MSSFAKSIRAILGFALFSVLVPIALDWFKKANPTAGDYSSTFGAVVGAIASISHLTWFYPTVFLICGVTLGVWVDTFARRVDGSRMLDRQRLGSRFLDLAQDMQMAAQGTLKADWPKCIGHLVPKVISVAIAARKLCRLWAPESSHLHKGAGYIIGYYMTVGRLLEDGHISEARSAAAQAKREMEA